MTSLEETLRTFLDSKVFAACTGATCAWALTFLFSRSTLHRSRADSLLKVQRQLFRQLRDLMTMREFYEPIRHDPNFSYKMKVIIHGFCEERIPLGSTDFILEYLESAQKVDSIADADAEYQCLLSTYRSWMESYEKIANSGEVKNFDSGTGKAQKMFSNNELITLQMHGDYSRALIQTLDRAIKLNIEASEVLESAVNVHRNRWISCYFPLPRTPSVTNSVKGLKEADARFLVPSEISLSEKVEFPYAVIVCSASKALELSTSLSCKCSVIDAWVSYTTAPEKPILASASHVSFQDAANITRSSGSTHFFWVEKDRVVLADAWFYLPSVLINPTIRIVGIT